MSDEEVHEQRYGCVVDADFDIPIGFDTVNVKHTLFLGGHFEFFGKATSETGYRSHFAGADAVGSMTLEEYARKTALALNTELGGKKKTKRGGVNMGQSNLFGGVVKNEPQQAKATRAMVDAKAIATPADEEAEDEELDEETDEETEGEPEEDGSEVQSSKTLTGKVDGRGVDYFRQVVATGDVWDMRLWLKDHDPEEVLKRVRQTLDENNQQWGHEGYCMRVLHSHFGWTVEQIVEQVMANTRKTFADELGEAFFCNKCGVKQEEWAGSCASCQLGTTPPEKINHDFLRIGVLNREVYHEEYEIKEIANLAGVRKDPGYMYSQVREIIETVYGLDELVMHYEKRKRAWEAKRMELARLRQKVFFGLE